MRRNVLFLSHSSDLGGAELNLLAIVKSLDKGQFLPFVICQGPGKLPEEFKKIGVKVYFLKLRGWRKVKYALPNFFTILKLRGFIKKNNISLICANSYRINPYAALSAKLSGIKSVCHVQDVIGSSYIKRFLLRNADCIIVTSDAVGKFFKDFPKPVVRIYNGVDLARFDRKISGQKIRDEFSAGEGDLLIGMAGQITPWKGHKDFIVAVGIVGREFPNAKFIIVGDKIFDSSLTLEELKRFAVTNGIADRVIFAGFRKDIPEVIAGLDIFVLPSWNESFSLVVLEAMAMAKSVISTQCGGPEEIVANGITGITVPVKSPDKLAAAIAELIRTPALRKRLAEAGYRRAKEEFDFNLSAKKIQDLFLKLSGKKILLINPFGIGDVLFTTPVIKAIKNAYPDSYIGYWCNERVSAIFKGDSNINSIFALSRGDLKKLYNDSWIEGAKKFFGLLAGIKKGRFDVTVDFSLDHRYGLACKILGIKKRIGFNYKKRGRFLSDKINIDGYKGKHVVEYYLDLLKLIGIKAEDGNLYLSVPQDNQAKAQFKLARLGIKQGDLLIGISAGGGASWGKEASYKHWPALKYAQLADNIICGYKAKVLLLGDDSERAIADIITSAMKNKPIDWVGKTTLEELAAAISCVDILITNDGGPLHIAVALGKKTLSIFGPVDEKVYGPYPAGRKHIVIKKELSCRPCYNNFRFPGCLSSRECINDISVDDVLMKVEALL